MYVCTYVCMYVHILQSTHLANLTFFKYVHAHRYF
jgi:hypothetical protein